MEFKNRQIQITIGRNGFSIFTSKIYGFLKNILLLERKHFGRELRVSNFSTLC